MTPAITLVLDGHDYQISELGGLSKIYWWILDYGDLFIESAKPLAAGEHLVQGKPVTEWIFAGNPLPNPLAPPEVPSKA